MNLIQLIACIGLITGCFVLLHISPMDFTEGVFRRITSKPKSIRSEVNESTRRKKKSFLRREIEETQTILRMTGRAAKFPMVCALSLLLFLVGAAFALTLGNLFLVPVLAVGMMFVPFWFNVSVGTTIIEYIRNTLKRVRKKESNLIMASQNLEDFDREGIRELTKPLFAIPPHQFIFNCGSIDKRFYMDLLQLEEAEYNLIRFPQRGVCLFKCGNERYLLEVHAPAYKEALFGTAGGR